MKNFYVITNRSKDEEFSITNRVKHCIEEKGGICHLCGQKEKMKEEILQYQSECVLVVGGDGTLIEASRELYELEIPLLGINMGTLGYLTEVELHNVESAIEQIMNDQFTVENRMMLYGSTTAQSKDVALNDIVVVRRGSTVRILNYNLYVNGQFLNSYMADGIIISTPTGSTAYNLSAGGPIVEPTASLMVVTPICSHALNSSSIVFSDKDEIVIEIGERRKGQMDEAAITFDGVDVTTIRTGESVRIKKAYQTAKIMKLSKISFLETLREKMRGN